MELKIQTGGLGAAPLGAAFCFLDGGMDARGRGRVPEPFHNTRFFHNTRIVCSVLVLWVWGACLAPAFGVVRVWDARTVRVRLYVYTPLCDARQIYSIATRRPGHSHLNLTCCLTADARAPPRSFPIF